MNTLIVGDLHGQWEIAETAIRLAEKEDYNLVFIGDYLDSYTRGAEDCVKTLLTVLDAIENSGGKVQGLWGNHEKSYTDPYMMCSGYNPDTAKHVVHLKDRMDNLLEDHTQVGRFLVSHGGISQRLLDFLGIDLETYLGSENFNQIGSYRGGRGPCGGLYWCDWNAEFEPVADRPQIVGHTRGSGIREKDGNYCIDNLENDGPSEVLLIRDTGDVEVIEI